MPRRPEIVRLTVAAELAVERMYALVDRHRVARALIGQKPKIDGLRINMLDVREPGGAAGICYRHTTFGRNKINGRWIVHPDGTAVASPAWVADLLGVNRREDQ